MREPTIALAFTPESWVETLHRHFTDHGGARVRQLVMDPSVALDDDYEILVASARWPALTPGLVGELHDRGRRVLGVVCRGDRGSHDVLARAGVDRVVDDDASPLEFLEALLLLTPDSPVAPVLEPMSDRSPGRRVVVGGPGGSGSTEIAIALAAALARHGPVTLVDADEVAPSVAQRLALPIEPNLRTAIEAVEFGTGELDEALQDRGRGLRVVAGLPNVGAWAQVRPNEVLRALRALGRHGETLVLDVGPLLEDLTGVSRGRFALTRAVIGEADELVVVGAASPVGLSRAVAWIADATLLATSAPVHVVLDRAPRDAYRRREIAAELERCFRAASCTFVPGDSEVARAAWAGTTVGSGPFTRAIDVLADAVAGAATDVVTGGEGVRGRFGRRHRAPRTRMAAS